MDTVAAFVLHHRPYRESSLLLEAFTSEQGRISLVAKGVRRQRKRHDLQLFQPLWLSWYGRGELLSLKQAEIMRPAYRLVGRASLCGLYLNELLVKLLPLHEAESAIFTAYETALSGLQQQHDQQIILRIFEKTLLNHLGYGLELQRDAVSGEAIDEQLRYCYHPDNGLQQTLSHDGNSISGRSLRILHEERGFDALSLKEIKGLMRKVINYYLGDRPLHSRQLFADLNQFKTQK